MKLYRQLPDDLHTYIVWLELCSKAFPEGLKVPDRIYHHLVNLKHLFIPASTLADVGSMGGKKQLETIYVHMDTSIPPDIEARMPSLNLIVTGGYGLATKPSLERAKYAITCL